MSGFRGFLRQGSFQSSLEPRFGDTGFTISSPAVPSSFEYNLKDLLSSGASISPTDTSILHDSNAINNVISNTSTDEN